MGGESVAEKAAVADFCFCGSAGSCGSDLFVQSYISDDGYADDLSGRNSWKYNTRDQKNQPYFFYSRSGNSLGNMAHCFGCLKQDCRAVDADGKGTDRDNRGQEAGADKAEEE